MAYGVKFFLTFFFLYQNSAQNYSKFLEYATFCAFFLQKSTKKSHFAIFS